MHRSVKFGITAVGLAAAGIWATGVFAEPSVDRGQYLVDGLGGCGNCHTPRSPDGSFNMNLYLAGGFDLSSPPAFTTYARNITPDVETGIGAWSVEEIVTAIREGHTPEGELIGPPMPIGMYNRISREDATSIALYLQSIPAIRNEVPESEYNIPIPEFGPALLEETPPTDDPVAYGEYLATVAHCFECHTPMNEMGEPLYATMMGAGGFNIIQLPDGQWVQTANITPDMETGIGAWSDDALRRAIIDGISANGHILFPIMPSTFFKNATDEDINAIIAYLRTIPAVSNRVEKLDWMAAMGLPPMETAPALE